MRHFALMVAAGALLSGSAFAATVSTTKQTIGTDAPKQTTTSTTTGTSTAPAQDPVARDPMHALYGNTMVIKGPEGQSWQYLFQTDKSYVMLDGQDKVHRGAWDVQQNELCLTPAAIPMEKTGTAMSASTSCHDIPKLSAVGDVWSYHGTDGKPFNVTLKQGMDNFMGATGTVDTAPGTVTKPNQTTAPTSPVPGGTVAQ